MIELIYINLSAIYLERIRMFIEVVAGKGQFSCANIDCSEAQNLLSWEVHFG